MSVFCKIDDKSVPMYRIMWIAQIPHFCGHEECEHEGHYEVRLEQGESVWATQAERDDVLSNIEIWHDGREPDPDEGEDTWS